MSETTSSPAEPLDADGLPPALNNQPDLLAGDSAIDQGPVSLVGNPDAKQESPVKASKTKAKELFGRALIDIPAHDLKCGDYTTLPSDVATALHAVGQFDLKARPE